MQRSKLFTAILFSIAVLISGFTSVQAQEKKKEKGGNSPVPIGIQVAEPIDRDKAKVAATSVNVRTAGANVFADVRWEFLAPQGSRVETVDVEVIGQVLATITARMEATDGRRFDVVATRKLN